MGARVRDASLDNLGEAPGEVLEAIFWELADEAPGVDARFHKEEWFSSTLLDWGPCGKLAFADDGEAIGFAQYAPPALFPRLGAYPAGRASGDAVYLAYCYVASAHRGGGIGSDLLRSVARELAGRGYRALEALGEHAWSGGWVLPGSFLARNRFTIVRDDDATPLWRLDLHPEAAGARRASAEAGLRQP